MTSVESPSASAGTVSARSATLIRMPFERDSVLLLEAGRLGDANRLLEAALASRTLRVSVTASRLAEDSWRRGFRWIAIASGDHLAGGLSRLGYAFRTHAGAGRCSPTVPTPRSERFGGTRWENC